MSFSDGAKTKDETATALRGTGLVRMRDDAWIEQRGCLERVFVQKIRPDQLALDRGEARMGRKRDFHLAGARLEGREEVAVATLKVLEDVGQLAACHLGIEREDALDNMVRPRLVGGIEVSRLGRRPEWTHDNSCRIRAKIKTLTVQNLGSDKMSLEWAEEEV